MAVGDLNGDGIPDLVEADYENSVSVLLGNGNGTFQAQNTFSAGNGGDESVALGDLTGDGNLDIVAANRHTDDVAVLLGNGDGTFQAPLTYATSNSPIFVAVADVNGDGIPDLVVANNNYFGIFPAVGTYSVSVLLGNGNGTFQAQQTYATGRQASSVVVADLTGDGIPDIVTANYVSGDVSVLLAHV